MVTQIPISLKIDSFLLEELDREVMLGLKKRNWHINRAIKFYLDLMDTRRRVRINRNSEYQKGIVRDFIKEQFPESCAW